MHAHPLSIRTFPPASLETGALSPRTARADARLALRQNYRPGRPVPGWLARVLNWL